MKRFVIPAFLVLAAAALAAADVIHTAQFQIMSVVPRHIFTPGVNGYNLFTITCDNPEDAAISLARIYDIKGARVSDMVLQSSNPYYVLVWDGKTSAGGIAHAGIYLYKIEVAGHVWSGSVVVAR